MVNRDFNALKFLFTGKSPTNSSAMRSSKMRHHGNYHKNGMQLQCLYCCTVMLVISKKQVCIVCAAHL